MKPLILALLCVTMFVTTSYAETKFIVKGNVEIDVNKLYLEVCNALNTNPRERTYTVILDGSKSRCLPEKGIIYLEKSSKRILAHELAHLCIAERFWAEPNEKIAELIAQYAEYETNK